MRLAERPAGPKPCRTKAAAPCRAGPKLLACHMPCRTKAAGPCRAGPKPLRSTPCWTKVAGPKLPDCSTPCRTKAADPCPSRPPCCAQCLAGPKLLAQAVPDQSCCAHRPAGPNLPDQKCRTKVAVLNAHTHKSWWPMLSRLRCHAQGRAGPKLLAKKLL